MILIWNCMIFWPYYIIIEKYLLFWSRHWREEGKYWKYHYLLWLMYCSQPMLLMMILSNVVMYDVIPSCCDGGDGVLHCIDIVHCSCTVRYWWEYVEETCDEVWLFVIYDGDDDFLGGKVMMMVLWWLCVMTTYVSEKWCPALLSICMMMMMLMMA